MSLNYQQVREQIQQLGEKAPQRAEELATARQNARNQLAGSALSPEKLREKVEQIVRKYDPNLRCALPVPGIDGQFAPLNACYPLPGLPERATILAADGSQIVPNRHEAIYFGLINVGAIQMQHGSPAAPESETVSSLFYDEDLYNLTDAILALRRDLEERTMLAALAGSASPPVVTFTDGPMELWEARDRETGKEYRESLKAYTEVLLQLQAQQVVTAGYVDKPAANLVVRLLEVAMLPEEEYANIKTYTPLRGVLDSDLFLELLAPGERSCVFAIQSRSSHHYQELLALHFFYLNVGREGHPWLARVEIPAWVAENGEMLANLHATLVHQCYKMGNRPYPYILHRAHETAVVTLEEKQQVAQMIRLELQRRGVTSGEISHKQSAKELPGRTAYKK